MSLHITYEDITKLHADAYINSTNTLLVGFSGVDKLIHELGGEAFEAECEALSGTLLPGEATITNAHGQLLCRYVIHTSCPNWQEGVYGEAAILKNCYRASLELAEEHDLKSVAMPLIGAGNRHYPLDVAISMAEKALREHLSLYGDMDLTLALRGLQVKLAAERVIPDLDLRVRQRGQGSVDKALKEIVNGREQADFVDLLLTLIDAHGFRKDSEVYKAACMTRQSFNKIINRKANPAKGTIVKLAFGMKLSLRETEQLFGARGLKFTDSALFDVIVRYYLENHLWDLNALYEQLVIYGCEDLLDL